MRAKLVITLNNSVVGEHQLTADSTSIGRKSVNDIQIDDLAVSGQHARILLIGSDAFLEDLGSTNGTFVNGQKVNKQMLKDGDTLLFGKHKAKYENAQSGADDLDKTVVIKPYAVGMEGTGAFQAAALERKRQEDADSVVSESGESSPEGSSIASLQLLTGANTGKKMRLTKSITRLGKAGEQSAAIARRPNGFFIMYLGGGLPQPKRNGEGIGTQAEELKDGDILEIGKVRMKFRCAQ